MVDNGQNRTWWYLVFRDLTITPSLTWKLTGRGSSFWLFEATKLLKKHLTTFKGKKAALLPLSQKGIIRWHHCHLQQINRVRVTRWHHCHLGARRPTGYLGCHCYDWSGNGHYSLEMVDTWWWKTRLPLAAEQLSNRSMGSFYLFDWSIVQFDRSIVLFVCFYKGNRHTKGTQRDLRTWPPIHVLGWPSTAWAVLWPTGTCNR